MAYATASDIADLLGRALTDTECIRVDKLLDRASGYIDSYVRGSFTEATTSDVVRLVGSRVRLPNRPVTAVSSVKFVQLDGTVGAAFAGWRFDGIDTIDLNGTRTQINLPEWLNDDHDNTIEVTYTHGYATVPADVAGVCETLVYRAFKNPDDKRSETIGEYSYAITVPATGVTFGAYLDPNAKEILDRYRNTVGTVTLR